MFIGAIPKACAAQVLRVFPVEGFEEIRVCCSGSFRLEQTLASACSARLIGNDVSLLTSAIGLLAAGGSPLPIRFKGKLEFVEQVLEGTSARSRVAAVVVASEMSRYLGPSERDASHLRHYVANFASYLGRAEDKLGKLLDNVRLDGFELCDFREHAARAAGTTSAVIGFPPTYKGGYERLYRFLDENIEWPQPSYAVWDPSGLPEWLQSMRGSGIPFCVGTDHLIDGFEPVAAHIGASRKAIYLYADGGGTSLVRETNRVRPFRYEPVDGAELDQNTEVLLVPVGAQEMCFLKDRYLAKGIAHTTGHINLLVYLGGRLAGGFIYTRSAHDPAHSLYLLSDFSIVHEKRFAKLISLLATAELPVSLAERKLLIRVEEIVTTAFTKKAVSMKYRGAFKLTKRGEGFLQYASEVRRQSPQEIYRDWFRNHASREAHRPGASARSDAAA